MMNDNALLQISIKDFIEGIGIPTKKEGSRYFCSSPFSRDSNWSFVIYPTNTFFDFSTGHGGNIINLVSRLYSISFADAAKELKEGIKYEKYKPNYAKVKEELFKEVEFDLSKYVNKNPDECAQIHQYALSRGISEGYFCGVFFTRNKEKWERVPALGFLHVDKNLKPCGSKFRSINPNHTQRYSSRGRLMLYMTTSVKQYIENTDTISLKDPFQKLPVLHVTEGEINAISLNAHMMDLHRSDLVVSFGAVSSALRLEDLPESLQKLQKKLIIDYDGNEELYQQRLKLYTDLDAQPIKLILPKGEDINSLYVKNEMWKIENLILN